jgi:hypothetical protein
MNKKKKAKQEKFLIVASTIIDIRRRLTPSDINQDLIVIDVKRRTFKLLPMCARATSQHCLCFASARRFLAL